MYNTEIGKKAQQATKQALEMLALKAESDIIADCTRTRKLAERFAELTAISAILRPVAQKIAICGTCLRIDKDANKQDARAGVQLGGANFCRQRLCPQCQRRRSLRMYADAYKLTEALQADNYTFLHLTLTIPNVGEKQLKETLTLLNRRSSELLRSPEVKRAFRGALRTMEVTYSEKRKDYHPHLHILCAVRPSYFTGRDYLSKERLNRMWDDLNGMRNLQIHIEKCYGNTGAAVAELAKYCFKPLDLDRLDDDDLIRVLECFYVNLKGRRLVQTFGVIRAKARDLKLTFGEDEEETATREGHWYSWDRDREEYCMTGTSLE